jgi:hypothetical protein
MPTILDPIYKFYDLCALPYPRQPIVNDMKREENDITQHSQANLRTYYKHKVNHLANPRSTYRLGTFSNTKARLTNSRSSLDFA